MTAPISLVTIETGDEDQKSLLSRVPPINLFRALAHAPQMAARVAALGSAVKTQTRLTPSEMELIALRCAARVHGDYVLHLHRAIAQSLGISADQVAAAEGRGPEDSLDGGARNLLAVVDATISPCAPPRMLGGPHRAEVEVALAAGYFMMLALVTRQLGVPPDDLSILQGTYV